MPKGYHTFHSTKLQYLLTREKIYILIYINKKIMNLINNFKSQYIFQMLKLIIHFCN